MAFKKVILTPEEEAALQGGGNFFKFHGIGSKMIGRFVKTVPQTGQFAKKDRTDWIFRARLEDGAVGEVSINPTKKLQAQLTKADLKPNYAVKITLVAELDIGKENKMPEYEVEVDDAPAPGAAKPPPPLGMNGPSSFLRDYRPPPKPAADDDVPF